MKMLFEGMFGTWAASRGFLALAAVVGPDWRDSGRPDELPGRLPSAWATARCANSGLPVFIGGGYGEIETVVTEAEWAW